ncbi:MAG: HEAT repeat domain-containing protein [Bacteroidota bacterium]
MVETAPLPLPDTLAPGPSERGFRIGLYLEHLEEAASLWEQRAADRENPELPWTDLGEDQDRLEAHLDALMVGGELALAVCRQQALEGDAGELHAALRVFCRHQRSDLVGVAMEGIDPEDDEALDALSDALTAEMPDAWVPGAVRPDRLDDPRRLRLAADLIAHRQLAGRDALLDALPTAPAGIRAHLVRALGRTADGIVESSLRPLLTDEDPQVRLEAAVTLLRSGSPQAAPAVLSAARTDPALVPTLVLAGHDTALPWLHEVLKHPPSAAIAADTLGLMGAPLSVGPLIEALSGDAADEAAYALVLITGADLTSETFIEDIPSDDELFEEERERIERGEPLHPPDQEPRGTTITGPSTDPEAWQEWWDSHGSVFESAERFRLGHPAGPESQVASLAAPFTPHRLRGWMADELAVRYRMPLAFETTWDVHRQLEALGAMRTWAAEQRFVPGRWYVSGHYAQ